ncbi:MAG: lipoate--protein ligase family protein [Planctomycetes bacterium]|nr:lipoate--protein ligase family protein [Planctomycetota bacterium]
MSKCETVFASQVPSHDESTSLWEGIRQNFDVTLDSISLNLSLDEILLTEVENNSNNSTLRFWETNRYAVILGRSNQADREVRLDTCRRDGIGVFRRSSGGGAVVLGPGCLAYSLMLPISPEHRRLGISTVTQHIMNRMVVALQPVASIAIACGISDLAINGLKFSGNSQRWMSRSLLHHGTILYEMDLERIGRYLQRPSREPEYRQGRDHLSFVTNIPAKRESLVSLIASAWFAGPQQSLEQSWVDQAQEIANSKYCADEWTIVT